ncbi:MAG TPA: 50S ribosomal protein P1 [Thermoplasmata archaeon]|nr:50S ribosomal protein P1 [Thermoplasmata archaeon]
MEYIYSAMLLHSAGKEINEENIKKVLTAAGVKVDEAKIKALTASLETVDIEEVIKSTAVTAAPAAPPAPAAKEEVSEEKKEKKEEKEEEVSEEEAAAGLSALFG